MFNFKTLLLTTIATLGLAADIQACPICRAVSPNTPKGACSLTVMGTIAYIRDNADALLQEYEQVLNDPQTVVRAKEKMHDALNTLFNLEKQILQSKCTTKDELFVENLKNFDMWTQKATDAHGWVDALFPVKTASRLNKFAHDGAQIFVIPFLQRMVAPSYMTHELLPYQAKLIAAPAETKTKLLEFNDKTRNPGFLAAADIICEFPAHNKELCLQFGQALHAVLKDEAFWAGHNLATNNNFPPQTDSFIKLQKAVKALELAFSKTTNRMNEIALPLHYQHEELMYTGKLELSLINY